MVQFLVFGEDKNFLLTEEADAVNLRIAQRIPLDKFVLLEIHIEEGQAVLGLD